MIMWIVASLVLTTFVAWNILKPLLAEGALFGAESGSADETSFHDSKERSLRALKDLELDFAMGKLSQDDYEQSRAVMTSEIAQLLDGRKQQS